MAELPLVVSDWNGYRDLVQHGVNGFLVSTSDVLNQSSRAPDELETAYADGRLNYDQMIGLRSLGVVVDHDAYVQAFQALLSNPQQRMGMAHAALKILQSRYSPSAVARAYRELWGDLSEQRSAAAACADRPALPPLLPTYGRLFAHYATAEGASWTDQSFVRSCDVDEVRELLHGAMNSQQLQRLSGERLSIVADLLSSESLLSLDFLVRSGLSEEQSLRVVGALLKLGILHMARV